jgi:hypothetical protein
MRFGVSMRANEANGLPREIAVEFVGYYALRALRVAVIETFAPIGWSNFFNHRAKDGLPSAARSSVVTAHLRLRS